MKKIIALLLTIVLMIAALPSTFAEAADFAELYVDIKPASAADGRLILEIEVQVRNGEPDQAIHMLEFRYENELIASVERISGQNTAYIWSNPLNMSLTGMTSDLELEISYIDFRGNTVQTQAWVSAEAAAPKLSFKRTANKNAVAAGETVTLTYFVKNEGSMTLHNVEVYDDMTGVGSVGSVAELFPGDLREFTKEIKVEKDEKSQPRVSYNTQSGEQETLVLESVSIVVGNPKLTVTLKSDVAQINSGDSVTLVCSVVNEGNIAFGNVTIYDEALGAVIENAQIEVGKAYSWNKLIKPVASQNYMFTVKAVDAGGQVYTATSNMVTVEVIGPTPSEGVETLEVSVTPNTRELAQPGEITFNFLLRNTGTMDATGVTISDRDGNVLEKLNTLAPGDKMVPIAMHVKQTGEYYFTVDATLASGTRVQRVTMPINIAVGGAVASTEPLNTTVIETPAPTPETHLIVNNDRMAGIAPWVLGLIIVIALLIVACVVVLVLLQVRAAHRREEEEAEEAYLPPQNNLRRPPQQLPERDPYDYREEISRVATEYSRPVQPRNVRRAEPENYRDEDEDIPTVYKARRPEEPRTKRS